MNAPVAIVPTSIEDERLVLGGLLLDAGALGRIPFLKPSDFYLEKHAFIYRALLELANALTPIDFGSLSHQLKKNQTDVPDAYLTALVARTPTPLYVEGAAERVKECANKRGLLHSSSKIAGWATDGVEYTEAWELAVNELLSLKPQTTGRGFESVRGWIDNGLGQTLADTFANPRETWGLSTGFYSLDRALAGLECGTYLVAGRASMGKTSFALSAALGQARKGIAVGFISLEMTVEQLLTRCLAYKTGLPTRAIKTGYIDENQNGRTVRRVLNPIEKDKVWLAVDDLRSLPLHLQFAPAATLATIRADVTELIARHGVGAVWLDYIQLVNDSERDDYTRTSRLSRGLKTLSGELGIPLLVLCQLSRKSEGRENHIPQLSDLRDSGRLEEDADGVFFCYRQDYYALQEKKGVPLNHQAQIHVAKYRNDRGVGAVIDFHFDERLGAWNEIERRTG